MSENIVIIRMNETIQICEQCEKPIPKFECIYIMGKKRRITCKACWDSTFESMFKKFQMHKYIEKSKREFELLLKESTPEQILDIFQSLTGVDPKSLVKELDDEDKKKAEDIASDVSQVIVDIKEADVANAGAKWVKCNNVPLVMSEEIIIQKGEEPSKEYTMNC